MSVVRNVVRTIKSHKQEEGGGFIVRRPFPSRDVVQVDPFLLLDEMGPADYAPGANGDSGTYFKSANSLTPDFVAGVAQKFFGKAGAVVTLHPEVKETGKTQ